MTAPTTASPLNDIPFPPLSPSVPPSIISDSSHQPSVTSCSTSTTSTSGIVAARSPASTTIATSPCHSLSNSRLTAAIVVPIILLAILSPILIVWFLSWRRRRIHRYYNQRSIPKDVKLENEMEKDTVGFPPQARQRRSSPPERSTASLPPPSRRPFTTTPDQRESTQQLRTSRIPNHSLGGFNFGFSRRATMFSARSTQSTIRDPSVGPSSAHTWILPPPSASRPMTLAQLYIPPRVQTPILPESPLAPQQVDQTCNINPDVSSQSTTEMLPHPDGYGKVHTRASSMYSLSVENLSAHNSSNLQAPFSQPHPDAVSEISGLSFDRSIWVATQQPQYDPDAMSPVSDLGSEFGSELEHHQPASNRLNEFSMIF